MNLSSLPMTLNTVFSFLIIIIALNMPMRLGTQDDQSSPPFTEPTSSLRSPEDRLTLWQFMTVSWMHPLISCGRLRKLEDEDVWKLGYEFQHRGLHENFRELKGSVVRRLLAANGLDLVITTLLATMESVASKIAPVAGIRLY